MNDRDQLLILLKKYLKVSVDKSCVDYDGDAQLRVTVWFDEEEICTDYCYVHEESFE